MLATICILAVEVSKVEISGFFEDSVVSADVFLEAVLWEDILLKETHAWLFWWDLECGGFFFWKLPGKRACGVLLEWMLQRTLDVWKGLKHHLKVDNIVALVCLGVLLVFDGLCWCWSSLMMLWHWFTLPSSLIIICHDFIERNTPKNVWWYSGGFLLLLKTWADCQSLLASFGSNFHCWCMNGICEWIKLPLLICVNWIAEILTTHIGFSPKYYFQTGPHPSLPY